MRDLRTKLQRSGRRMTSQRAAVYAALSSTTSHPTAEELYNRVRDQLPGISLATVYNSLEVLVEQGMAIKITGERSARYDATCTPHAHARCTACGAVLDLPDCDLGDLIATLPTPDGFTSRSVMVELEGICATCQHDAPVIKRRIPSKAKST